MMQPATSPLRVLVTGATGFVGSAIASQCEAAGLSVRRTGRSECGGAANYIQANLLDTSKLSSLLENIDCVIHAAGLAHQFGDLGNDENALMAANVDATANLVRAAGVAHVAHFV